MAVLFEIMPHCWGHFWASKNGVKRFAAIPDILMSSHLSCCVYKDRIAANQAQLSKSMGPKAWSDVLHYTSSD